MHEYSEGYEGAVEDILELLKGYDGKSLDGEKFRQEIAVLTGSEVKAEK